MRAIDADALIEKLNIAKDCNDCEHNEEPYCRWKPDVVDLCEAINDAPTIEPERKKGKWQITEAYPHNVYCSVCHKKFAQTHWAVWEDGSLPRNFCPNCGADMRGEQE